MLITACGDNVMGPRSAPKESRSATAASAGGPAELLTQLAAGKCADVTGESQAPGTPLILYTCKAPGNQNQLFTLPPVGTPGPITVYNAATCVTANGTSAPSAVVISPCNGGAAQQWTVTSGGYIQGVNGLCLDVTRADSTDGNTLIVYTCHNGVNQRWASGTAPILARDLAVVTGDRAGIPAGPALVATFNVSTGTQAAATVKAPDGSVRTSLPVSVVKGHASVVLLGLRANTSYTVSAVALNNGSVVSTSTPVTLATGSLPSTLTGVRLTTRSGALDGGYVLAPVSGIGTPYAVIFDTTGTIVWYRGFSSTYLGDIQQQPNGHYTVYEGTGNPLTGSGVFHEMDAQGNILHDWTAPPGYSTDLHEIRLLINGSGQTTGAMLFGRHWIHMDMSAHGGSVNDTIQTSTIFRVASNGTATALFTGTDRFTASDWIAAPTSVTVLHDFDHPNAIQPTPDGGFLVSWRNLRAITKHDSLGHFQWQLGGNQATMNYAGDPLGLFDGQHHVRLLSNGNITIFDNGTAHSPSESRGLEMSINLSTNTATVVRIDHKLDETVFSATQGDNQRLANGNSFLDYTVAGRMIEFNPSSGVVWDGSMVKSDGTAFTNAYRAFRIRAIDQYVAP